MQFEIKSRWTGAVIFTAEIEADENTSTSIKLGLAVKVAVKARADLRDADLRDAYLRGANLRGANLRGADLRDGYLRDAYLRDADLRGANLRGANLRGADLRDADLRDGYLRDAYLRDADLRDANLNGTCGLNDWIKCIQVEDWPISYTSEVMQIGCQRHPLDAWRNFSDAEIRAMDGMRALNFWHKWREVIFKIIEMAPAQPTKAADPVETEAAE